MDFLYREDAPLTEEEWRALDGTVVSTAQANLVGRRFLRLFGPLGMGAQAVWVDQLSGVVPGVMDIYGEKESDETMPASRLMVPLLLLYKDFRLLWRNIASTRGLGAPIDTGPAAAAAAMLARTEDRLILYGTDEQPGLMNVPGHAEVPRAGGWAEVGSALASVVQARRVLVDNAAMGPYALVLSPALYTNLLRVHDRMGRLELELVQQVADAGVFQSPALAEGDAVLVSAGPDVVDLAVAEDMQLAFLGPENMNLMFRIIESVALRVRRPEGICVLAEAPA